LNEHIQTLLYGVVGRRPGNPRETTPPPLN
jgi:hypothetical protein